MLASSCLRAQHDKHAEQGEKEKTQEDIGGDDAEKLLSNHLKGGAGNYFDGRVEPLKWATRDGRLVGANYQQENEH